LRDRVAVVSTATTGFSRDSGRSRLGMATDAGIAAIRQAGLSAADIDGVCARGVSAPLVQTALGLPRLTYWSDAWAGGFPHAFLNAVYAVNSGACEHALVVQSLVRMPYQSRAAAADPLRRLEYLEPPRLRGLSPEADLMAGPIGYAAWASSYLHEYGCGRESLGRVAINSRSNAVLTQDALVRTPLTMAEYLQAPLVYEPFGLLDMDVPADGAHAFVLSRTEHARDLVTNPVLVHAAALGAVDRTLDQLPSLTDHAQHVVVDALQRHSDLWLPDFDVLYLYDGFTWIMLAWLEAAGLCAPGEATAFLREHWDTESDRVLINGSVPVNTHGGSLSAGHSAGAGHLHEAVVQLQGTAGANQVPAARRALVLPGGIFLNAHGFVLHA
jgi:acetyl-CoA acetyltransferase